MCGNGIRCVAKYVYDYGLTDQTSITIESFGQVKHLDLTLGADGKVETVRVNMGAPVLTASEIPVVSDHEQVIDEEIEVDGQRYRMTCVSMGNPHAVVFLDHLTEAELKQGLISSITRASQSGSTRNLCRSSTEIRCRCVSGSGELARRLPVEPGAVQRLLPVC